MKRKTLLISLGIFCSVITYGQNSISSTEKDTYKWFDSIIGQKNSALSLGPKYFDKIRTINDNHKYYNSQRFQKGDLTFNGQPYFDILMKYDIHFDQIIIQVINKLEKYTLQLEKSKVQNFFIANKKFINISDKNKDYGFVEELKKGEISLYKKHMKDAFAKLDRQFKYSRYKEANFFLISYKNKFIEIRSKSDLRKQFPTIRKEINRLYKEIYSSKNTDASMVQIISKIELLISTKM